jgi:hypothetical protein
MGGEDILETMQTPAYSFGPTILSLGEVGCAGTGIGSRTAGESTSATSTIVTDTVSPTDSTSDSHWTCSLAPTIPHMSKLVRPRVAVSFDPHVRMADTTPSKPTPARTFFSPFTDTSKAITAAVPSMADYRILPPLKWDSNRNRAVMDDPVLTKSQPSRHGSMRWKSWEHVLSTARSAHPVKAHEVQQQWRMVMPRLGRK